MQHGIESLTIPALTMALDAASMRQTAIAANIANANTPGYVPKHLSFDAQFARVSAQQGGPTGHSHSSALALRIHTQEAGSAVGDRAGVHLDQEVAALSNNLVHYQSLLKGLNRYLSLMSSAVTEGKR